MWAAFDRRIKEDHFTLELKTGQSEELAKQNLTGRILQAKVAGAKVPCSQTIFNINICHKYGFLKSQVFLEVPREEVVTGLDVGCKAALFNQHSLDAVSFVLLL